MERNGHSECLHRRRLDVLPLRAGQAWLVGFFSLVMMSGQCAAVVVDLAQFTFPKGTQHESLGDDMRLYGRPVQIRVFDAPLGVPELIRTLSDQQPALVDLRVLPGQAILSGSVNESLWVVQIEGIGETRAVGSISAMSAGPAAFTLRQPPEWLPEGSRLRFDFSVLEGSQRVTDEVWTHSLPPKQLRPLIRRNLTTRGWITQSASDELGLWTRKGRRLRLDIYAVGGGSSVRAQSVLP